MDIVLNFIICDIVFSFVFYSAIQTHDLLSIGSNYLRISLSIFLSLLGVVFVFNIVSLTHSIYLSIGRLIARSLGDHCTRRLCMMNDDRL